MSIELKIKVKHLAEEARIIRAEEQKLHGMEKWKLQHHRKTTVRDAARRTQVAYQMLRGRDWKSCARLTASGELAPEDRKEVDRMIAKYGPPKAA